jgi:hypothetical protein
LARLSALLLAGIVASAISGLAWAQVPPPPTLPLTGSEIVNCSQANVPKGCTAAQIAALSAPLIPAATPGVDFTAGWNALVANANSLGRPIDCLGATIKINGTVTTAVDVSKTSWSHCNFDMTGATSATAPTPIFSITTSNLDINAQGQVDSQHPFIGNYYSGPTAASNVDLFVYTPVNTSASVPAITGVRMGYFGVTGFRNVVTAGDGFVNDSFDHCTIGSSSVYGTGTFLKTTGTSNAGEDITAVDCYFVNSIAVYWDESGNVNLEFTMLGGSIDGVKWAFTGGATEGTAAGRATFRHTHGHEESNGINGATPFFWCGSFCEVSSSNIITMLAGVQYAEVDSGGGFTFKDNTIGSTTAPTTPYFISGAGRIDVSGTKALGNTSWFVGGLANNLVPSFTLPSSSALGGTATATGGFGWNNVAPWYDTSHLPAGATPAAVGDIAVPAGGAAYFNAPIRPGQWCIAQAWLSTDNTGTGVVYTQVGFLDAAGNILLTPGTAGWGAGRAYGSAPVPLSTAIGSYAPAGSVICQLIVNNTMTAGKAYLALPYIIAQ